MAYAGTEYTVVGWTKQQHILDDENELLVLLRDLCKAIDMRPLKSMSVHVDLELEKIKADKFEDEGGATASLILSTSHASIHGWPKRTDDAGYFWLTIGSCREFSTHVVDRIVTGKLSPLTIDRYVRNIEAPPVTRHPSI